jgi:dTDP-4-amino-4,6-dideoxygalactose transaminase
VRDDFLIFGAPTISEDEIEAVVATLRSRWIGTGPRAKEFESRFADYVGVEHAVAVNSCTSGLHLGLYACGVGRGDEVITTALTWCATSNVILHLGARPVFVDVDPRTGNIDPQRIEAALTERTRAILPVHLGGRACDMDAIMDLAERRGLVVVQDAAHAIESTWRGRKIATYGNCTAYSFYPNKNITCGEGGMVATRDAPLAERLRILSLHGVSADAWKRFSSTGPLRVQLLEPGFKYNLPDMLAALGLKQLEKIEPWLRRREEIWARYDRELARLPLLLPPPPDRDSRHARHLYQVAVDTERTDVSRDALREALRQHNIGTGLHYEALHLHPFYREHFGTGRGMLPHAERFSDTTLSLPLSGGLADADVLDVIRALHAVLA